MTSARLATVARQELRTQLRGPLFWVLLLLLLFLTTALNPVAMIPSGESTVAGERAFANSPHALAQAFAIGSFFAYTFFASLMAGLALIRDDEAGIGELLHATPLTRFEYLAGKLGGALAALAIALVAHLVLTVLVREGPALLGATAPDHGPFRPRAYLSAILLFAGPGILFVATSAAAVAAATRRAMAVYALPTVLFLYTIGISWNFRPAELSPVVDRLLIALDPLAIRWLDRRLFSVDRGLAYFNSAPPELDLLFLVNRLLALLLPMIGFAVAVRFFRPLAGRGRRRRVEPGKIGTTVPESGSPAGGATFRSLGELAMTGTAPRMVSGVRAVFRAEAGERFRQPSFYFFLALLMLVVGEVGGSEVDLLGGQSLLSAGVLAVRTIPVVTILACLYLLFSVVESAERDRATGFADILYASAVPDAALLFGRQLANVAVIASICAACVAAGLGTLAISTGSRIEPGPLVLVFVLVLAPTFLLWSAFCDAVAAIVRNRHAALAVGLVALVATGACFLSGAMTWASNWPLWGALRWSDLGLFPLNGPALLWNRIAALAGAAAFVALSRRFLARTERDPSSILGRLRLRRLVRAGLGLLPFLTLPVLVQAFLAVRIQEGFQGSRARARADEFWLRNSATWQDEEPPAVEALDLVLDLEPRTRALRAVGTFELRNRAEKEMRWIPFTSGDSTTLLAWTVDGVQVPSEDRAGLHVLTLPVPVPPGGAVRVGFEHDATLPRGFTRNGGGTGTYLLPAGVLLGTRDGEFLPWPGFVDRPLAGAAARPVPARYPDGTVPVRRSPVPQRRAAFRTRVEVRIPEPYSVQSVGLRTAEWHAGGKVHTVFESEAPVGALHVVAGRWNVLREGSNEVHFHPAHAPGAESILRTMVAARDFYSERFHPYPWSTLRLSEVPDLETNASSYPTSISFSEGIGFLSGAETDGALAFSVTAHEVAHQWWGHLLGVADGPGTGLLVEGMANYSTLLLHEALRGEESRREFARQLERLYLERRRGDEQPILSTTDDEAGGEAVVSLRGAWVLWMLDRKLGSESMRAVLRELLDDHLAGERLANPDDLLAAVRHFSGDGAEIDRFVGDWLEGTALPEIRLRNPRIEKIGPAWQVGATAENVGSGRVEVEIAAMAAEGLEMAGSRRLVRLVPGSPVEVEWQLEQRPDRLEVDPAVDLLQRNRERAVLDLPPAGL